MNSYKIIETISGIIVLVVTVYIIGFATLFYLNNAHGGGKQYNIGASFEDSATTKVGAAVTIAGVKVGHVTSIGINKEDLHAIFQLKINEGIFIPNDSTFAIEDATFLGEKVVTIEVGSSEEYLQPNEISKHSKEYQSLDNKVDAIVQKVVGK